MNLLRTATAVLLIASAGGLAIPASTASASACSDVAGVTVVVGAKVTCDPDGAGSAAENFADAGHELTYVDSQPGFVCQIDGSPATSCARTPSASSYWGLFWSDGKTGTWTYSNVGAPGLIVPAGGWVAFVYQDSATRVPPSMTPVAGSPSATPRPAEITSASKSSADGGSGGLPYAAAAIGILLIAGMAATVWRRRAAGGPS